jgi:hypothetical protein
VPDDAKSCVNRGDLALFELQVGVDLFGADAGASLDGGAGADAGIESEDAGMSYPLPPSTSVTGTNDGSAEADAGHQVNDEQDAGDGGYHGSAPGTIVPPVLDAALDTSPPAIREGCQLMPDPDGSVLAKCDVAGVGQDGSSCISSADCAPGLGCVSDEAEVGATCMRYCCEGDASCSDNRFCTRRPLKTAVVTSEPVMVPVCAPSEQCDLMDPYPCPVDGDCKCPSGTACAPVGKDGARRCAAPGNGQSGEACPCAAGYFCSSAQVCLKLCQADLDDCGSGICQPIGGFPEQWGLCVNLPG